MIFRDRTEAGKKLAEKVFLKYEAFQKAAKAAGTPIETSAEATKELRKETIVLALPRGGVPVAYEIAQKLQAPLDLIVTHKLGAPGNEELAIGAVAEDGSVFLDPDFTYRVTDAYVKKETKHQLSEIQKRILKYRGGRPLPELRGKTVFLVDDGVATGNTMQAAIRMAKKSGAEKIVVATPVLPPDTLEKLKAECDDIIFLSTPEPFWAIGQFYGLFEQLDDETVRYYLQK